MDIYHDLRHHGHNVVDSRGAAEWVTNKWWLMKKQTLHVYDCLAMWLVYGVCIIVCTVIYHSVRPVRKRETAELR